MPLSHSRFRAYFANRGASITYVRLDQGSLSRLPALARAARFDAVILQRKLLPGWQIGFLRRISRHLVFDFDDAVGFRDSYDRRGVQSRGRSARFARTVRAVDTVIAGNDFLADCALRAGARVDRVHVIPTCVEPRLYPLAQQPAETPHLDLVWIGSASTLQGLEESRPIWEQLARAFPTLRLRIICDRFPESFPIPVVPISWTERDEGRDLAAAHIGVGWLPDDLWSRGKCGLKILQYQAAGLPVIANPVGSHCEMIKGGETGFLATTPAQWIAAVGLLGGDVDLRRKMGHAARQSVEAGYSVAAWSDTVVSSMTGTTRPVIRAPWKIDHALATSVGSAIEPHSLKAKTIRTLNQIGDR